MSGEHGDGLARSLWNAKLFGPEVYACFEAVKRAFDPDEPDEPRQGRRRARPRPTTSGSAPTTTRSSPSRPSSTSRARAGSPAPSRCARASAPAARRRRDDVPELHGHPRRGAHHPGPGQRPPAGHVGRACPPTAWPTRRSTRSLDLCLQCKACKTECPSNVDMAKLKAEVLHQYYQGQPDAARVAPDGPHPPAQPDRLGDGPAGQLDAPAALVQVAPGEDRRDRPPADAARRSTRTTSASGSDGTRPTPAPGRGARSCCSTTASPPTTPPSVGRAAVRVLEAAGYRVELAGLRLLRPAGDLEGAARPSAATWRARTSRGSSSTPAAGTPIVGCEPSCLLTLVDEYRDFRLGPDADLVASAAMLVDAFVADPERVPELAARSRSTAASCSTATASRRRWWARRGRSRP